ncbi:hypothetical protein P9112_008894 [Eukaryota sp. TZLM1-RC]
MPPRKQSKTRKGERLPHDPSYIEQVRKEPLIFYAAGSYLPGSTVMVRKKAGKHGAAFNRATGQVIQLKNPNTKTYNPGQSVKGGRRGSLIHGAVIDKHSQELLGGATEESSYREPSGIEEVQQLH